MKPFNLLLLVAVIGVLVVVIVKTAVAKADPATVQAKIKDGAKIVDVRTPAEFDAGHHPGAVNIPLAEIPRRLTEFGPKDKPIVVYCRSGNRSSQALRLLQEAGYTNVTNAGGLKDMPK